MESLARQTIFEVVEKNLAGILHTYVAPRILVEFKVFVFHTRLLLLALLTQVLLMLVKSLSLRSSVFSMNLVGVKSILRSELM
jgi:membrane-anchored protein YejM (alkaline phosphatase superfamily)